MISIESIIFFHFRFPDLYLSRFFTFFRPHSEQHECSKLSRIPAQPINAPPGELSGTKKPGTAVSLFYQPSLPDAGKEPDGWQGI